MFISKAFIELVFFSLLYVVQTTEFPPTIKKCRRTSDSREFSSCFGDAIHATLTLLEKGIPELGVESAQPLKIRNVSIGEGSGIVHVMQNYTVLDIYNIIHLKIKKLSSTVTDKELKTRIEAIIDRLMGKGIYSMNGRILVLPIFGDGNFTIDLYNVKISLTANAPTYLKKGVLYMKFKDFKLEIDPAKIVYNFENLFDGNKALGDNINKVLNDNDLAVFKDVKLGYERVLSSILKDAANNIVTKVPFEKLFAP